VPSIGTGTTGAATTAGISGSTLTP
jgi:hypothetical protein